MTPDKQPANELQASDQMHQAPGGEISPLALPVADRIKMNATAVRLAYITTFGFFALIFCLIALDRIPGANQEHRKLVSRYSSHSHGHCWHSLGRDHELLFWFKCRVSPAIRHTARHKPRCGTAAINRPRYQRQIIPDVLDWYSLFASSFV
jgi:hypothetical protein